MEKWIEKEQPIIIIVKSQTSYLPYRQDKVLSSANKIETSFGNEVCRSAN